MKPILKQPGTMRSKLNCDLLRSTSALKLKLRRYTMTYRDRINNALSFWFGAGPCIGVCDILSLLTVIEPQGAVQYATR